MKLLKKLLAVLLAAAALALPGAAALAPTDPAEPACAVSALPAEDCDPAGGGFFTDVPEGAWYYTYVKEMCDLGVLTPGERYEPGKAATRMDLVRGLYRLHLALGGAAADPSVSLFTDVPAGDEDCAAAVWAWENGVTKGCGGGIFDPDSPVTREMGCAFVVLFAAAEEVRLVKVREAELFPDSWQALHYTRSAMAACQMAGIFNGQDGRANPGGELDRAGTATILCLLYRGAVRQAQPGEEYVSTDPDAYLYLYEKYNYTFGEPIPESEAVPTEWFKDAVFVGDSLTVGLQMYSGGALGEATFLCTTSLSAPAALSAVTSKSLHPTWNGVKMKVEDAVAACGAKNVYIMLGINNMRSSVATSTASLVKLIGLIEEKSPDVNIIVQSVTPLTATSNILTDAMNNRKIDQYNEKMREYCAANGWYYLDVSSAVKDDSGNFNTAYCGDAKRMGIHFSRKGAGFWAEYIRTHVPEILK